MTNPITQIKQIIEDEAEKYADVKYEGLNEFGSKVYSSDSILSLENRKIKMDSYKACAELLLPVLIKAIEQRNFFIYKSVAPADLHDLSKQGHKYIFEDNQELLNILKEGK
ncbi:MAG TPA: hypothetical protein V6C58_24670 [Allocoleopsis sp.]